VKKGQVLLVVGAVVLTVVLYTLPYAPMNPKQEAAEDVPTSVYDLLDDVTSVNNELDSSALALITQYEIAVERNGQITYRDSLVAVYDMLRKPVPAAFHALKRAEETNGVDAWTEAGERFLLNAKYMGEHDQKAAWYGLSKECFEKALALTPDDLDIKVDLGVCLVEGAAFLGIAPMQGIGLLKEVEQIDPTNIKALVNLGYFSVRSGQFDKAEERFNQALKADSDYIEAYLYLADLHEKQQQPAKAIEALNSYVAAVEDPERKAEVTRYIKELSSTKNRHKKKK